MSTIAVIPARGGSVRIPYKNIRLFHGKPIMAYSIEAAKDSGIFDRIIVSTDDDEIAAVAIQYGAEVHARAVDDGVRGTQEVAAEVLEGIPDAEYACVIYATAPMLSAETLQCAFDMLMRNDAPYVVPVATWLRDPGQFYIGEADSFLAGEPLIWAQLMPIDPRTECDINTEEDFLRAEIMYASLYPEGK
jgi:pseudaminic acid cytidylyltransferase